MLHKIGNIILIVSVTALSCKSGNYLTDIRVNNNLVDSLMSVHGKNIAVISCLRCGCFVDSYNNDYTEKGKTPSGYQLLADTSCNKMKFPVIHTDSRIIDRISEDLYNVTFLKKRESAIQVYIAKLRESQKLAKVADAFFKD